MTPSLQLVEALEEVVRAVEASKDQEKKRKRKRALAIALGLIGQGPEVARAVAHTLPKRHPRRLRRMVDVAAFATIGPRGKPKDPTEIRPGDTLYISPVNQPGTGLVTKDASRIPYAIAGEAIPAGETREIKVTLLEKLWLTDGNPCPICDENSIQGWIPIDEMFSSGDWEPLAHPNCKCSLETRAV